MRFDAALAEHLWKSSESDPDSNQRGELFEMLVVAGPLNGLDDEHGTVRVVPNIGSDLFPRGPRPR